LPGVIPFFLFHSSLGLKIKLLPIYGKKRVRGKKNLLFSGFNSSQGWPANGYPMSAANTAEGKSEQRRRDKVWSEGFRAGDGRAASSVRHPVLL
jgi:hypothetical protein